MCVGEHVTQAQSDILTLAYTGRLIAGKEVKFSSESDLKDKECQELLLHYMPDHVRNKKITQRLFVK